MTLRVASASLAFAAALALVAGPGHALEGYKAAPEYQALGRDFRITSVAQADFNDDGVEDVAVAYRSAGAGGSEGGLLILRQSGGQYRPAYHVFFDSTYASEVRGARGRLEMTMVHSGPSGDEEVYLAWKYGDQFVFNGEDRGPLRGLRAIASSTKRGENPAAVLDDDLDTAWAEGVEGTGVGESVTVKLSKPIGVGMIGVFPGKSTDAREFKRANRLHRALLEVQTESDVGDEISALDFSDLGINIGGDTEELVFANKPEFKFFKLRRSKALNLVVKIESVYLGDKEDDTHVAEIEVVPLIPRSETVDRGKKVPKKEKEKAGKPTVKGTVIAE
ncbi:MAG: hypothetical protein JXR83_03730 [Deltaproteobacteria bacterium]|nr:hypothetical protein [Deltaproteobacteria bacterium]